MWSTGIVGWNVALIVFIVWILHVAKFFSPVPEHVVADTHSQSRPQSQTKGLDLAILLAENLIAVPQIPHDERSTNINIAWLKRNILEELYSLEESCFSCREVQMRRHGTSNEFEDTESCESDGSIH